MSLEQVQFVRNSTLKLAAALEDGVLKEVPKGFNNNILWNLGHIYVVHENLIFKASGQETVYPEGFVECFSAKTSPKDWGTSVPTKETVLSYLEDQNKRIMSTFKNKLEEAIPNPISFPGFEMTTIGDLLHFGMVHETMHNTTIKNYNKFLKS